MKLPPKSPYFERARRGSIRRQASDVATKTAHARLGSRISDLVAGVFLANALTGIGVLTVPYAFQEAGFVLGSLVLVVCMLMAFITGTYVIEAEAIVNALHYGDGVGELAEGFLPEMQQECINQQMDPSHAMEYFTGATIKRNADSSFKIRDRFEVAEMGELLLTNVVAVKLVYLAIILFIYGSLCAFVVTVNTSLANTLVQATKWTKQQPMQIDDFYPCCLILTFLIAFKLCLGDVQKTKTFTMIVMIVRFIAMVLMLSAAFERVVHEEMDIFDAVSDLPQWNTERFSIVFGNCVYVFSLHHCLPSMIAPLKHQGDSPCVVFIAFAIVVLLMVMLSATAMLAYGTEVQSFYNQNFEHLNWLHGSIGLFILAYPTMAISTMPASAITLRNTLGKLLGALPPDPDAPVSVATMLLTAGVLVPPFGMAYITRDITVILKYTGGYFGLTVSYALPLVLVIYGRRRLSTMTNPASFTWRLKSPFANWPTYAAVLGFYALSLGHIFLT